MLRERCLLCHWLAWNRTRTLPWCQGLTSNSPTSGNNTVPEAALMSVLRTVLAPLHPEGQVDHRAVCILAAHEGQVALGHLPAFSASKSLE